jgi:hypothetical protein
MLYMSPARRSLPQVRELEEVAGAAGRVRPFSGRTIAERRTVPPATEAGMGVAQRWKVIGMVTFVLAGFLLLSMGGAIVAAPVTVPLMSIAACRRPTRPFRMSAMVLSGLTVA